MTLPKTTLTVSPFLRVEGDLRVEVDVADGRVTAARIAGTMYRGFERLLRGRPAMDAIGIVPRICGTCSLSHAAAAASALRATATEAAEIPRNGMLARCVMLGAETLLNHLSHFYLAFAPDLALPADGRPGVARFAAMTGSAVGPALAARRRFLPALGLFAGKWPNSLALLPAGSTRPVDASEIVRALACLQLLADFVETQLLADSTSAWLELRSAADLARWLESPAHRAGDLGTFVAAALERGLDRLGCGPGAFLSFGGWETEPGKTWLRPGFLAGTLEPPSAETITEHLKYSWFDATRSGQHPSQAMTIPAPDHEGAYSWTKAPRYGGRPVETGPLARMLCDGDPLLTDVVAVHGAGVLARVLARLHETVRLVAEMSRWMKAIDPDQAFAGRVTLPEEGAGLGVVEAPRGTLMHWTRFAQGKIQDYQVVTPTAWNFSPRDDADLPGPAESALVGAPADDTKVSAAVLHVVRSFDPCLYCSVH
jgi:Ni,Fe-hydrogenase I large subunit